MTTEIIDASLCLYFYRALSKMLWPCLNSCAHQVLTSRPCLLTGYIKRVPTSTFWILLVQVEGENTRTTLIRWGEACLWERVWLYMRFSEGKKTLKLVWLNRLQLKMLHKCYMTSLIKTQKGAAREMIYILFHEFKKMSISWSFVT